eukprot:6000766-Pleurochrysis_carterae.AAC.1
MIAVEAIPGCSGGLERVHAGKINSTQSQVSFGIRVFPRHLILATSGPNYNGPWIGKKDESSNSTVDYGCVQNLSDSAAGAA